MFHPQTHEGSGISMRFLVKSGDQIVKIETAVATRIQHMPDSLAKCFLAVTVLERVEEQKTLRVQSGGSLYAGWRRICWHQRQGAANCFRACRRAVQRLITHGGGKRRKRRQWRILLIKSRALAIT